MSNDYAGLVERLSALDDDVTYGHDAVKINADILGLVREAAAALTSLSAERDRQREHIRKQAEDIMTLGKLVYASETETWKDQASDLRRKLEEARSLAEQAEHCVIGYAAKANIEAAMHRLAERASSVLATLSGASE